MKVQEGEHWQGALPIQDMVSGEQRDGTTILGGTTRQSRGRKSTWPEFSPYPTPSPLFRKNMILRTLTNGGRVRISFRRTYSSNARKSKSPSLQTTYSSTEIFSPLSYINADAKSPSPLVRRLAGTLSVCCSLFRAMGRLHPPECARESFPNPTS